MQALFRRAQLKALVDAHGLKEGLGGNLTHDEITVIRGALDLTHKTAADCMTPMETVRFKLPLYTWHLCQSLQSVLFMFLFSDTHPAAFYCLKLSQQWSALGLCNMQPMH